MVSFSAPASGLPPPQNPLRNISHCPRMHESKKTAVCKSRFFICYFQKFQVGKACGRLDEEDFKCMWASRLEPSPPLAQAKAKAKLTKVPPKPRLASLHWCQDLNHALHSIGHGLINFRRENQPEAIFKCPPEAHPKMLIICSDQESTQIASVNYLVHHRHCYLLHVPDPGHRGWNDQWLALVNAAVTKRRIVDALLSFDPQRPKTSSRWEWAAASFWFPRIPTISAVCDFKGAESFQQQVPQSDPCSQFFGWVSDDRCWVYGLVWKEWFLDYWISQYKACRETQRLPTSS